LEPRLREAPNLAGGHRILGLALARLQREPDAAEQLRVAVRQSGQDWLSQAALASLLLRGDPVPPPPARGSHSDLRSLPSWAAADADPDTHTSATEAIALLREALAVVPSPAVNELLGAARWRVGQDALGESRFRVAAQQFRSAAADFNAAALRTGTARAALPVRQSTSFVGEAVALLCAGETETAQRLFSCSPVPGLCNAEPLSRFAARLFEFCEEFGRLSGEDRSEAVGALRDVVLSVTLQVGFYDGRQPVSMAWTGGPD
jgi:hypothetical protein